MLFRNLTHVRGVLVMALLLIISVIGAQPAFAQNQQTWLPDFSPDRHVYVDPLLSNNRQAPVNLSSIESDLIREGQRHGLQVYVVATQQGSDLLQSDIPGRDALDKLVLKWQSRPGFPSDNYLVVMWVRRADNPNKGSVAANGGNWFSDWNMTGAYFSDPQNGPVIPNLRRFMPQDPAGAFVAVVQTVNSDIDTIKARQAKAEADRKLQEMMPYYLGGGGLAIAFLGTLIWLLMRNSSRRKRAQKLIADFETSLNSANELYLKLRDYRGFLTDQGDWKSRFKGRTLTTFTAACKDFADFSVRRKVANDTLEAAKKAFERNRFPSIKGLTECEELLSKRVITITGDDLPLEEATLFGGLVEKADYEPGALLNAMSELFDKTNKALSGIVKAFEGARQNKTDVEQLDAQVNGQRKDIEAAELTMAPYEATIAELKRGQAAFVAILSSDPLEAFSGSETVEAGYKALGEKLIRAIGIKKSLPAVKTQIDGAESKATKKRGEDAVYLYVLGEGESQPQTAQGAKFMLAEKGSNPDTFVADARGSLKSAHELVYAAKLDEAVTAKEKAEALAKQASDLVDDIVAAKAWVETKVTPARNTLASLRTELPDADTAVVELKSDFLAKNYGSHPTAVDESHATEKGTPSLLAQVKALYDAQNFVGARALVKSTQAALDGARTKLTQAHALLKELRRLRQDSRDTVATCLTTAQRLRAKLRDNAFTTAAATDNAFADADRKLGLQKAEADKKIADWPAVNKAVHEVVASFDGFDKAIDAQRRAYDQAKEDFAVLDAAIGYAAPKVANDVTTDDTKRALASVRTARGQLQNKLNTAKSDWVALSREAGELKADADGAKEQAELEIKTCAEAQSAYQSASEKINEVNRRSYGEGVDADLSTANSRLRESSSYFRNKDYAEAKSKAKQAYKAAEDADDAAESLARRRKRDREEAAAAAARAAAAALRASQQRSSGGGFSGGGSRPGGGSSSGGGGFKSSSGGSGYSGRSGGGNY
ncbi:hypothetical protein KF913_05775 [Candidatus Obscuribacterales bacterium]|nr:hypothetical protein [Candidatus Obscuribacterales bacterium]